MKGLFSLKGKDILPQRPEGKWGDLQSCEVKWNLDGRVLKELQYHGDTASSHYLFKTRVANVLFCVYELIRDSLTFMAALGCGIWKSGRLISNFLFGHRAEGSWEPPFFMERSLFLQESPMALGFGYLVLGPFRWPGQVIWSGHFLSEPHFCGVPALLSNH